MLGYILLELLTLHLFYPLKLQRSQDSYNSAHQYKAKNLNLWRKIWRSEVRFLRNGDLGLLVIYLLVREICLNFLMAIT